jgi:hypothetical protein
MTATEDTEQAGVGVGGTTTQEQGGDPARPLHFDSTPQTRPDS